LGSLRRSISIVARGVGGLRRCRDAGKGQRGYGQDHQFPHNCLLNGHCWVMSVELLCRSSTSDPAIGSSPQTNKRFEAHREAAQCRVNNPLLSKFLLFNQWLARSGRQPSTLRRCHSPPAKSRLALSTVSPPLRGHHGTRRAKSSMAALPAGPAVRRLAF
jgi:hypothetical protein